MTETVSGIKKASAGIPKAMKDAAMAFFASYARENRYFTGGDVLSAWRATGEAIALADWRNRWGAICTHAKAEGLISKAGRVRPTSSQSHSATLVLWESNLCVSSDASVTKITAKHRLKDLTSRVEAGALSLEAALWKAHELGIEDAAHQLDH